MSGTTGTSWQGSGKGRVPGRIKGSRKGPKYELDWLLERIHGPEPRSWALLLRTGQCGHFHRVTRSQLTYRAHGISEGISCLSWIGLRKRLQNLKAAQLHSLIFMHSRSFLLVWESKKFQLSKGVFLTLCLWRHLSSLLYPDLRTTLNPVRGGLACLLDGESGPGPAVYLPPCHVRQFT